MFSVRIKKSLVAVVVAGCLVNGTSAFAHRGPEHLSAGLALSAISGSALSAMTLMVVEGVAGAGSELVVRSITPLLDASGESVRVVLTGADHSLQAIVEISAATLRSAGLAVGKTVRVLVEATGYCLIAAGTLIAFVPNQAGRALLRQEHTRFGRGQR
jgi:hypothetical protein